MTDELCCDACQRLFRGEVARMSYGEPPHILNYFIHHINPGALDAALCLPCAICSLAWKEVYEPSSSLGNMSSEVIGFLLPLGDRDGVSENGCFSIRFKLSGRVGEFSNSGEIESRDVVFAPGHGMSPEH
jgi:hypothetical protein